MFILAPIVACLTLFYTPGWAGKCPDKDGISDEVRRTFDDKNNEHRSVVVTSTTTRSPGWAGKCSDEDGMSDEVRQAFVNKHNEYRSLVAKGKAVNGKIGGFAPKAARMFKVSYDCDVEKSMMAWAKKCIWGHSPQSERVGLGENIWMLAWPGYNKTASAIYATTDWFLELKMFGVPVDNQMTFSVFNRGVGHYTQVVWQQSDRIGCAVQSCPNSATQMTFAGCQYKMQGNMIGAMIYDKGSPCTKDSDCQCENCKCNATEALCIRPDSTPMPGPTWPEGWSWPMVEQQS